MRVQWRCEKQASVLFGITTKISPSTFISFVIRAAKVKVSAMILAFEWYRKCLTRKGIFGILNLAKIRCGIRENARYLNRERDITATREARFATGCEIFLPVYREFEKSYLLRANASQPSA